MDELEQAAARAKKRKTLADCAYCKTAFYKSRSWQVFCSEHCRAANFSDLRQASLLRDEQQRVELEVENERLRKRVLELEEQVQKLT